MAEKASSLHPDEWPYLGARWWKFDLHTHSPVSHDYGEKPCPSPREWLLDFMAAGIDCVAITDHDDASWIEPARQALHELNEEKPQGYRPLVLLPGVELTIESDFHLLGIFDENEPAKTVERLLGAVGAPTKPGGPDAVTRTSGIEAIRKIRDAGGIAIPAHVDQPDGLLRLADSNDGVSRKAALDPRTVRQILQDPILLTLEFRNPDALLPAFTDELKNKLPTLLGSDSHHRSGKPDQSFPGARFSWLKMDQPSLHGIRLALLAGDKASIRHSANFESAEAFATPANFIESISVEKARRMGKYHPVSLSFSPNLNTVIGGRGTGKSTFVHAIRLATQRAHELEGLTEHSIPYQNFDSFNRVPGGDSAAGGLEKDTTIEVVLQRVDQRYRLKWEQEGASTVSVEDVNGEWVDADVQEITNSRFPMQVFSQGHIAALTGEDQSSLLELIDQYADISPLRQDLDTAIKNYQEAERQLDAIEQRLATRNTLIIARDDAHRDLMRFEEADFTERVKAFKYHKQQQDEISAFFRSASEIVNEMDALTEANELQHLSPESFNNDQGSEQNAINTIERIGKAVSHAMRVVQEAAHNLRVTIDRERSELEDSTWQKDVQRSIADHQQLLSTDDEVKPLSASAYEDADRRKKKADADLEQLNNLEQQQNKARQKADSAMEAVVTARQAVTKRRRAFLETVLTNNDFIRIKIIPFGVTPRRLEQSLRVALGMDPRDQRFADDLNKPNVDGRASGIIADLLRDLPRDLSKHEQEMLNRISLTKERLRQASIGEPIYGGHFNNFLQRDFGNKVKFNAIQFWFPEDDLDIQYSRSADGKNFASIRQGSAGERAAAMLAFLLSHGNDPLILDQPEDDLDNRLVYDLIVQQMLQNKGHRQIIVITHNANIVVNGDADMVYAMVFKSDQCRVDVQGALQDQNVRDAICEIMEGGDEAFDRRYHRLGIHKST